MKATAWVIVLLIGVGCSAGSGASRDTSTTAPIRSACSMPTRFGVGGAANEIHGASRDAQLWGLALGPGHVPPRVGDELKIVWRMTGRGPLHIALTAPDGRAQALVFGPELHSASSYQRPGDEWGTGFRFVVPGCWHIHFGRTNASADVWLEV